MYALALSILAAVPPQAPPLQDTIAQAPPLLLKTNCGCGWGEPCKCNGNCTCEPLTYDAAVSKEISLNRPMLVFVNVVLETVPGFVVCSAESCFQNSIPRIIVAVPSGGQLVWKADLPASTTIAEIKQVAFPQVRVQTPYYASPNLGFTPNVIPPPMFRFSGGGGFSRGGGGGRSSGGC